LQRGIVDEHHIRSDAKGSWLAGEGGKRGGKIQYDYYENG